ncbi:MAG: rhodanese-related sulfurtransferase [Chitinophagaceae bacterium]
MPFLHNRISQKELKQLLLNETDVRTTLSFYHYFPVTDPQVFRDDLFLALAGLKVFGRIYVATEGINAQVSVPVSNLEKFTAYLSTLPALHNIPLNHAVHDDGKSFWVLKIKVREKIVADGIEDPSFSMENKGQYVDASEFNRLTADPDTIVVDMRNHYEYEIGHFNNALEVPSDTFREQLPMAAEMLQGKEENKIIMYCTGGIRCEKASAYLLHQGFKNVYHLRGGIINYTTQAAAAGLQNQFRGKNFVFDNRLGERITEDVIASCHQCAQPADAHVNCANEACHLLFIQCEACTVTFEGCCSIACRDFIQLPPEQRLEMRKGIEKERNIFNKSKRLRPRLGEL